MKKDLEIYNQKFKVFGRKKGRRSTNKLSISILKKYLLDISSDLINKNIILDIDLGATGFTVRVFFPKLLGDNFDGIKYCQQKHLEVVSESR